MLISIYFNRNHFNCLSESIQIRSYLYTLIICSIGTNDLCIPIGSIYRAIKIYYNVTIIMKLALKKRMFKNIIFNMIFWSPCLINNWQPVHKIFGSTHNNDNNNNYDYIIEYLTHDLRSTKYIIGLRPCYRYSQVCKEFERSNTFFLGHIIIILYKQMWFNIILWNP